MSPVGGVGINLAVQDAVAAANILAGLMAAGGNVDPLFGRVQARRAMPVVEALQRAVHRRVIGAALANRIDAAPALLRLLSAMPALQRLPARVLRRDVRREHIRSPAAHPLPYRRFLVVVLVLVSVVVVALAGAG